MSQQRILVVDDELQIRRLLGNTLTRAGYAVLEAASAREALAIADGQAPDAILLDLGLPDRDGLELVPLLNKRGRMAVIIISARDATDDKVAALDLGADAIVTSGTLRIDLANRDISRDGTTIKLTRKEFDVLSQLAMAPGRVVTHQRILAAAWPTNQEGHVEYLRIVVRNLRQKNRARSREPQTHHQRAWHRLPVHCRYLTSNVKRRVFKLVTRPDRKRRNIGAFACTLLPNS
jgi:two-component system KDP operon response regulator KdpE